MTKHIITGDNFPVQPRDIDIGEEFRHFWNAFDNTETEVSAYYVIKLCQKKGGWYPFTREEIETIYQECGHRDGFTFNRLVNPQAVLAKPAEEFEKMAKHAQMCRGMPTPIASVTYAMSHGNPETINVGGGWIAQGTDGKYYVTDDFVNRCFKSSPAIPVPEPTV